MRNPFAAAAFTTIVLIGSLVWPSIARAQGEEGDQLLDGVGETAPVARYVFSKDGRDSSRNNAHATVHGAVSAYVEDPQFGSVLSLPGEDGCYVEIPGSSLIGVDSFSVTAWVFLRSAAPWQRLFDFGRSTTANCFCTPIGANADGGYRARITSNGSTEEQGPVAPRIETDRWVHLAVVLDAAGRTFTTYANGVRAGHATDVTSSLERVLDQGDAAANRLYVGKSQYRGDPYLNAKVHDFRVYSIALTPQQVATIKRNALADQEATESRGETGGQGVPAEAAAVGSMPVALGLASVPDIAVETTVRHLPRLPPTIPGVYRDLAKGPKVRVIWPSPADNRQVLEAGTYTLTGVVPGTDFRPKAIVTVTRTPATRPAPGRNRLETFSLGQVVLRPNERQQDTPLIRNRDKFILALAKTDPDRFLYMFRDAFGQEQPEGARPLGGWDSQTTKLRGHATGHYLSAIAQAYAGTTYDDELRAEFLRKMDYLIETLSDLSRKSGRPSQEGRAFNEDPTTVPPGPDKTGYDSDLSAEGIRTDYWNWGRGFISAYPPDQFILLEQGATYGSRDNQIWAPYYTLHKILAGLLDCHEVGGNEKALEIARGMGLWVYQRLSAVPASIRIQMWNRYIAGEYGGMNEVMARLFRITEDRRFLECAVLFDNTEFFFGNAALDHGLARNVDTLRGKHANQHIPQVTGALETYRGTQDAQYFRVAENFWDICTQAYMYSIGGVAGARVPNNAECFTAEPNTLFSNGFARGGQNETCATYNLLKLSRLLFLFDPDGKYMDYYERALYNHILASVDEGDPGNTYHVPLNPGARKQFGNARMDGFSCCNGTALESSTKLQDSIYFRSTDNAALFVNLFVPSTVTWPERDVVLTQRTDFPYSDTTWLTIAGEGTFDVQVRVPGWASRGFFVRINGVEEAADASPGTYLRLRRAWKHNDTIELRMPFQFHLDPVMDQPNIASVFYGPVLLAAEEPAPRADWRPVTLDAANLENSISGDPGTLRFRIGDVNLKPFYETYGRHSVYLRVAFQ